MWRRIMKYTTTLFMFIVSVLLLCSCSSHQLKTKLEKPGEVKRVPSSSDFTDEEKEKYARENLNENALHGLKYLEEHHNVKISPLCIKNADYDPVDVQPGFSIGVSGIQAALVDLDIIDVNGFKVGQKITPHRDIDMLLSNFRWHFRKTHNRLSKRNVVNKMINGWTNGYEKTREEDRLQKYEKKTGDRCSVSSCSESLDITIIGFTHDKKLALVELDADMIFRGGKMGCSAPCYFNKIFFLNVNALVMARNCYFIQ